MPRYALPVAVLLQSARKLALAVAGALLMLTAPAVAAPNHIAAALVAEVAPDGTATLAIAMSPAPGWHGYWLNPGDAGYAMRLAWHLPAGASVGAPRYPVPQALLPRLAVLRAGWALWPVSRPVACSPPCSWAAASRACSSSTS